MKKITIFLKDSESDALDKLCGFELREPRHQAKLIVLKELERKGLLKAQLIKRNDVGQG